MFRCGHSFLLPVACKAAVSLNLDGVAGELFKGGMYGNQGAVAMLMELLLPRS